MAMQKEEEEQEAWDEERANRIDSKLQTVVNKQTNELEAMKKSHNSGKAQIEKGMNEEIQQ